MGLSSRTLASIITPVTLASILLTASSCSVKSCAGQCGPPFQLQVVFRNGTAEQDAIAAMRKCQGSPLVVRIGQPYRSHSPGSPGQWTAIIYTKQMPAGPAPVPLLTCLRHSPAVTMASWPD